MTSNINPNNINGAYPVAGQDNNSQGFRDNFTNTSTNFQYAKDEITDLQNKTVLTATLGSNNTPVVNNLQGSSLSNGVLFDMSEALVSLGTAGTTATINYLLASYQAFTASVPVSLNFTNWPASRTVGSVVVQISITNVSQTLQLPASVGAANSSTSTVGIAGLSGSTITFPAAGTYVYRFWTEDGGSSVYISDLTQSRTNFSQTATFTNVVASGNITGNIVSSSRAVQSVNYANITATGTYSLSSTKSINVLIANNTGYTATLNMPSTPIDGQICNFAIHGNTVTLAVGTGNVLPTFAGSTTVGTGFRYVYRTSNSSWYKIG
jgi:hypothetical protein